MSLMNLLNTGDPKLLEPLTCKRTLCEIEVGGSTYGNVLNERWSALDSASLHADVNFWPSLDLIAQLKTLTGDFSVLLGTEVVAYRKSGADFSPDMAVVQADAKSFRVLYPWHILSVNEEILSHITENKIEGTIREGVTIDGVLHLGEGSVILPGVYMEGVVVIGKNCKIGPNCYIRGSSFISDKCHVGQAVEVKNSILMTHVAAGHLSYLGDTIVCPNTNFGAGTIISNFRHDGKNHRSMVNGVLVDTGRRKFGAILGDGVHTGIHSAIYPGRKIWADVQTLPGEVIQRDRHE